jgi:signal peptidase I
MNKKIKSLLEIVLYFVIVIGLALGTPRILVYVMGTEYPIASITSGSMWPTLKKGDIVLIRNVDRADLKVGDIIVYNNSEQIDKDDVGFTIHRIIELQENELKTKGDANNIADVPIGYDQIVGRTLNYGNSPIRIPQIGKLTIWISEMRK